MKYVIVLGDGMADKPLPSLQGKTPMEAAKTPTLDKLSMQSELGMVYTVPKGMTSGSDIANLSVLGYAPQDYYTGRSPLEALSIGVEMKDTDVSLRCNVVTLTENGGEYEKQTILDHSAGEISTQDASLLLDTVKATLGREGYKFFAGTSYRHLLLWEKGTVLELTPPHDILTKEIGDYLPSDHILLEMMKRSYDILKNHPINLARKEKGLNPANSIWLWGAGTKPNLTSFTEKTGKKGAMISAVDLLKGIAVGAGMTNILVKGANGGLHTNYEGKAKAATEVLLKNGHDFVYVHVEAPDEMGHQGQLKDKIKAIEYLDQRVIRYIVEALDDSQEEYRLLVLPDHPTPIEERTHTSDPVPYLLYDSRNPVKGDVKYCEKTAVKSGKVWNQGDKLIEYLLNV